MIDMNSEELISFSKAAKMLPSTNRKKIHVTTLWRWCSKGLNGIKLDHVRLGRRMFTSIEALERFSRNLSESYSKPEQIYSKELTKKSECLEKRRAKIDAFCEKEGI